MSEVKDFNKAPLGSLCHSDGGVKLEDLGQEETTLGQLLEHVHVRMALLLQLGQVHLAYPAWLVNSNVFTQLFTEGIYRCVLVLLAQDNHHTCLAQGAPSSCLHCK